MSKQDALLVLLLLLLIVPASAGLQTEEARAAPLIIDHTATDLSVLPRTAIDQAKQGLHIVYGHTSHGSQLTTGMTDLVSFTHAPYPGSVYAWNSGGTGGALELDELGNDLGSPDFTTWSTTTRTYLNSHPATNVVIWSWCGELSWATPANVDTYLSLMDNLEADYPDVAFVYMTGHLDGTGLSGNLNQRNNQIRQFCRAHNKVLYDFADIESYDPDGNEYLSRGANDGCNYGNQQNWARDWQSSHTEGVDWYQCEAAHTEPLNANRKAYAAWNLWARLAGWQAGQVPVPLPDQAAVPLDPDHDGLCEDLNGNGHLDFSDVVLFFNQLDWIAGNEPVGLFDFNSNGQIDFNDVVLLFGRL